MISWVPSEKRGEGEGPLKPTGRDPWASSTHPHGLVSGALPVTVLVQDPHDAAPQHADAGVVVDLQCHLVGVLANARDHADDAAARNDLVVPLQCAVQGLAL